TNFKTKIYIALNIKNERTKFVLSRCSLFVYPLQLTKSHKKTPAYEIILS
ncbi:ISL3 family transposase, partial [Streptococcus suis]